MARHPPPRLAATVLLLVYLPDCTSWQVQNASPQQVILERNPERLRITRVDSTTVMLHAPRMSADTVIGLSSTGATVPLIGVPLSEIAHVAIRKGDTGKSLLLVGAIIGVLVVALAAASSAYENAVGGGQ
jgi:hypothetical protein